MFRILIVSFSLVLAGCRETGAIPVIESDQSVEAMPMSNCSFQISFGRFHGEMVEVMIDGEVVFNERLSVLEGYESNERSGEVDVCVDGLTEVEVAIDGSRSKRVIDGGALGGLLITPDGDIFYEIEKGGVVPLD